MSTGLREASDFDFKKDRAEVVGDVLRRWMTRSGVVRLSDRERIWDAWQRRLGDDAPHTRLDSLKAQVVTFAVDSSALLSELNNFRKPDLLEGLRQDVRTYFVRDIRFRLDKRRADHGRPPA